MDLLTKAEFEAGFGSHTPMFSGQTKCVRYYMNFGRALRLMKEVIAQEGHTFDANNKPGMLALQLTHVQWSSHVDHWHLTPCTSCTCFSAVAWHLDACFDIVNQEILTLQDPSTGFSQFT